LRVPPLPNGIVNVISTDCIARASLPGPLPPSGDTSTPQARSVTVWLPAWVAWRYPLDPLTRRSKPVPLDEAFEWTLRCASTRRSPAVGDATAFVVRHEAGVVVDAAGSPALDPVALPERRRLHGLALACFTKEAHADAYGRLIG